MANKKYDEQEGVWRTIGGRRVFIRKGQSLSEAMRASGKFKNLKDDNKGSNGFADAIRKGKMNYEEDIDAYSLGTYGKGTYVQFQDRESHESNVDYKGQPKVKSNTWARVWEDDKNVMNFEDNKYVAREKVAKYLDEKQAKAQNILSGNKGLSEKERKDMDPLRGGKLYSELTSQEKELREELHLRDMAMSAWTYGGDLHTDRDVNSAPGNEKYYNKPYIDKFYDDLGKERTEAILKQQKEYFDKGTVEKNAYTDSEGLSYNKFVEPPTEAEKIANAMKEANSKGIDDLYNLAQSKYSADTHSFYLEHNKIREDYLNNYDKYRNPVRDENLKADDIWHIGYKENMYDQFENAINRVSDDYNTMKAQDTLAIVKKEAEYSLHNKYLSAGGRISEEYDRKTYGDAKVDAAIMREQEFLRNGFTNVSTDLSPRGMVNSFDYSDMIIKGEKDGVQVTLNFNKNGDSAISLRGIDKNGGYGELMINDKNVDLIRDVTARGSVGSPFRESRPYSDYETTKLTIPESKEYYEKANAYYRENRDAHYYDRGFFDSYNDKLKKDIVKKRQTTLRKEYNAYIKEHPGSTLSLEDFERNRKWLR